MKRRREHLLKQIGIGIQEARFNRMQQTAPKYVRTEYPIRTLKATQIVMPRYLDEAKMKIVSDMATALREDGFIRWDLDDSYTNYNLYLGDCVKLTGTLRVVKPED